MCTSSFLLDYFFVFLHDYFLRKTFFFYHSDSFPILFICGLYTNFSNTLWFPCKLHNLVSFKGAILLFNCCCTFLMFLLCRFIQQILHYRNSYYQGESINYIFFLKVIKCYILTQQFHLSKIIRDMGKRECLWISISKLFKNWE